MRSGRGFTVIELMLVSALSFVALLGLLSMQRVAVRGGASSRAITEATALAEDKLEALARQPLAALTSSTESGLGPQGAPAPSGAYTRVATITAAAGATTIDVRVEWNEEARTHRVAFRTVRAP